MKKMFIILFSALNFTGCASYLPPKIENNTYTNYHYEFQVVIPEGWTAKQHWSKETAGFLLEDKTTALFISNNSNKSSLIIIMTSDFDFSYQQVDTTLGADKSPICKIIENSINDKIKINDFRCLYKNTANCFNSENECQICELEFTTSLGFSIFQKNYLYRCRKNDNCSISFRLIYDANSYFADIGVFNKMIESINLIK